MKTHYKTVSITEDDYLEACDSNAGWCRACEEFTHDFCEPDAREYECPACGARTCYGAGESLLMEYITIE